MSEHWSNKDRGYQLKMWVDLVDQNQLENYSNYRFRVFLVSDSGYSFHGYNCTGFIDFDGGRRYGFSIGSIGGGQTVTLLDGTYKIWHDNTGAKNFGIMAQLNGQGEYSPNTLTINGFNVEVPPIPRLSTSTVERYEAYFGQPLTINIKRNKESFKHKLRFGFGVVWRDIATNVDTSYTWTVPTDIINQIDPSATSDAGEIDIDTYDGDKKIGSVRVPTLFKINTTGASSKPTFTDIELVETNQNVKNVLGSPNVFLQVLSNIQCIFKGAVGSFGTQIKEYHAEVVNKNLSVDDNNAKFGVMNFAGDVTISAYIVDIRGIKSDVKTKTVKVLPYFSPTIFFTAERVGQNASTINTRTTCKVASININGVQKNSLTVRFSTSSDGGRTFTLNGGDADFASNQTMEAVNRLASLRGDFSPKESFVIRTTIADKLSPPVSFDYPISTERVAISFHREGVGIGMVHNNNKYRVQVAPGDVSIEQGVYRIKDSEIQNHQLTEATGVCIKYNSGDANNILKAGFYSINNCNNMPNNNKDEWYLTVIVNSDAYVMQQASSLFNDKIYTRQKRGNLWSNWVALQQEIVQPAPKFPDTEWAESVGEKSGKISWRVSNRVLYISIENVLEDKTYLLGSFPKKYLEHYKESLMLSGVEYSYRDNRNYLFQVNLDGTIFILNGEKGKNIRTVLSIPI